MRRRGALLLALLLPACGDDGSPGPGPSFSPSFSPEARLDDDAPGAASSGTPRIAGSGGRLFVAWVDGRNGATDIYFRRSLDAGSTWDPAVRIDADVAGAAASVNVDIAVTGDDVHLAWLDDRNGLTDVYYRRSLDAGSSWSPEQRIDTDVAGAADSEAFDLDAEGVLVAIAWTDHRSGQPDVRFNRSLDRGTNWFFNDIRLETGDAAGLTESGAPRLDISLPRVLCAWECRRNGAHDIFVRRSDDAAATWAPEVRMDTDVAGAAFSRLPKLASSGENVAVVWQDTRNGSVDAFLRTSTDGGLTWSGSDQRIDTDVAGAAISDQPQPWLEGARLTVGWMDSRTGGYLKPWARSSLDLGATWTGPEVKLDTGLGNQHSNGLRVVGAGPNRYALWVEARTSPSHDVFLNYSTSHGASWAPPDERLDTDAPSTGLSFNVDACAVGAALYVVWDDRRHGVGDIYFRRSPP